MVLACLKCDDSIPLEAKRIYCVFISIIALLCWGGTTAWAQVAEGGYELRAVLPHAGQPFTQGLVHDGIYLYESGGLYGQSSLRMIDPATGLVLKETALAPIYFAEGLALAEGELLLLTWREYTLLRYNPAELTQTGSSMYGGEGWGLTYDGETLYMSDGSATLTLRDPASFAATGYLTVTEDGAPLARVNEMEAVNGLLYANVWQTPYIYVLDPASGETLWRVDCSGLYPRGIDPEDAGDRVLNGIAYDATRGEFYVTGKLWPYIYRVKLLAPGETGGPPPSETAPMVLPSVTN